MQQPRIKKIQTLCLIEREGELLLGLKKRGFGEGRWNGFGGKLMSGESIEQAARRELSEEVGLEAGELIKRGVIDFIFQDNPEALEMHIFSVQDFTGEPNESEEMRPAWWKIDALPYDKMWPDDRYWLPLHLAGKNYRARFLFENQDRILDFEVKELE
jgi:8-oxo-dGTP pyrophosphatase MutT (NUDIX family)